MLQQLTEIGWKQEPHFTVIDRDWLFLVSLHLAYSKSVIWYIQVVPLRFQDQKMKNFKI